MIVADDCLTAALKTLGEKPPDGATRAAKQKYSQQVSEKAALALAEELRQRGLDGARPALPGELGLSGAERRMAGGIGAKKVDVTWATEECGLLLGISVKTINFRDQRSRNFQKNLTNRRGDMLFESVTLHRRFPYAVLGGILFLDRDAEHDATGKRRSTFVNAHDRLRLFTGRADPSGRDEQYEQLYIALMDANPFTPTARLFLAGHPTKEVAIAGALDELVAAVAERNTDFYECVNGRIRATG